MQQESPRSLPSASRQGVTLAVALLLFVPVLGAEVAAQTAAPSAPTGLQATAGNQKVDLSWDANSESDLAGYNVYRSRTSFQERANATKVHDGLVSSAEFTDSGLVNEEEYFYRVTAEDTDGNESSLSSEVSAVPQDFPPSAPTGLQATDGDSEIFLGWDTNTEGDLAGYNVYRSDSSFQEVANATRLNDLAVENASFTDGGVSNGTKYFYRVTAVDTSGNESGGSNEASATPHEQTPPSAPTGLQATAGDGQVDLGWDANTESDLAGYHVYRSTSSFQEVANATRLNDLAIENASFTDSDVSNGTKYFYRVTAVDDNGNESAGSNEASATPQDQTPPSAPSGLQATAGDSQVELGWDANTESDLAGYHVYRSTASFQEVANATRISSSLVETESFTDTGVANGTKYFYRVTAVDQSGNESAGSNEASATPQDETAPTAPSGLQATAGDSQVELGWDANTESDLAGYHVYRSTSSFQEVANATRISSSLVETESFTDTGVANGTKYFYRVAAVDQSGNESAGSNEASATPQDETAPTAPSGLQATAGDSQVELGWDANTETDLAGYHVYRSTSSFQEVANATRISSSLVETESFTDTDVANGTKYFYRVTAVDDSGNESAGSNEANATPSGPPVAETGEVTDVTNSSALLTGQVRPGGTQTTAVFEYFPTGQPDESQNVAARESPLNGGDQQSVSADISNLAPNIEYTVQLLAENTHGSDAGGTQSFTTNAVPPTAETGSTTNITVTGAQLNGSVNPNGSKTSVVFEYHPTQAGGVQTVQAEQTPLAGRQSQEVTASVSSLQPDTEYAVQVVASNSAGLQRGESSTFTTPSLNIVVDRSAQTPERGSPFTVTATISEDFTPTDVARLYYRQSGTATFQSTTLGAASSATYEGTVPGSAVTARGVEYYVELSNGSVTATVPSSEPSKAPLFAPVRVPEMQAGVSLPANQYRMISVPLQLDRTDAFAQLQDDFGPLDRSVWRLLRFNAGTGEYDEVTTANGSGDLRPGRAFWLITQSGETQDGESTFDVADGLSLSPGAFQIELPPGWSQVGNPRPYPLAWADVVGSESVMAPVSYDPSAPDSANFSVQLLRPWTGYWVFNPNQSPVQLGVPSTEADQMQATVLARSSAAADAQSLFGEKPEYAIAITARMEREGQPALRDAHTVMAVGEAGRRGVGVEDVAEPPPIDDHLRLSIVEEDRRLAGSLRPTGHEGYEWEIEVSASEVPESGRVRGELVVHGTLPPGFERRLMDVETGQRIPISNGTFTLRLSDERPTRHLRFIVGTEGYAEAQSETIRPDKTGLQAVYPNPARGHVSVDYQLKTAQRVQIRIYDLLGRRVETLVSGRRPEGRHTVQWSTRSGTTSLASGTYIVRMKTESASVSQRISIVR